MNQRSIEYIKRSLIRRRMRVGFSFALFVVLAVVQVRMIQTPYQAELRMLVNSKQESRAISALSGDFGGASDTQSTIARQEILIRSHKVYEYMLENSKYLEGPTESKPSTSIREKISQALFGRSYVKATNKWSKQEFLNFKNNIVFQNEQESPSFRIGYVHLDPEYAVSITQELAEALIAVNRSISRSSNRDIAAFLENKVADLQNQVEEQGEKIAAFMKSEKFPNSSAIIESRYQGYLDAQQKQIIQTSQVKQTRALLDHAKAYVMRLRSLLADTMLDTSDNERIAKLIAEIRSYERTFEKIESKSGSNRESERLRGLREKLEKRIQSKKNLLSREAINTMILEGEKRVSELESEVLVSMQNLTLSRSEATRFAKDIERLPSLQADLQRMLSKQESLTNTLKVLEERYFEVIIKQDSDLTNLVIIDQPVLASSLKSSKPNILLLSILVSFIIACAIYVLLDFFRMTIYDHAQIVRNSITHIGNLPHFSREEMSSGMWLHESISIVVHEFRRALEGSRHQGLAKVAIFVSSDSGAGKSLTSLAFAMGLSKKGLRVLLMDGDYRAANREGLQSYAPSILNKSFDKKIDAINGSQKDTSQSTLSSNITLATIFDRNSPGQEYTSFFSKKLSQNLQQLSHQFDYILIDMPPLFFTDTLEVINFVDAVVICAKEGYETLPSFNNSASTIEKHKRSNAHVFSIITDTHFGDSAKRGRYQYYFKRRGAA